MPEDVLPAGHLESELCAGDETVLLDHRVDGLHPAVSEVHPGWTKGGGGQEDELINILSALWFSLFASFFFMFLFI